MSTTRAGGDSGRRGGAEETGPGEYDAIVVGGGQAGLAMGHHLSRRGLRHVILEASDRLGAAWRERWDSLVLFTPARHSGLPGLPFPGRPDAYPKRDEVVSYLERYAAHFRLPVALGTRVDRLTSEGAGFRLDTARGAYRAGQVVVATGPFQAPAVPALSAGLAPEVRQLHSSRYRNPGDLPDGTVLIVGGGNTGFQIADELAGQRPVHLSIGSRQTPLPQRLLGRDIFWWLTRLRLMDRSAETRIGRRMRSRDPALVGSSPSRLRRRRPSVVIHPRAVAAEGTTVTFADGRSLAVDAVIWATGYRPDQSWIDVTCAQGPVIPHRRGVTECPGLYFLGLSWQHTRGSALLGWVDADAAFLAKQIVARRSAEASRALTA